MDAEEIVKACLQLGVLVSGEDLKRIEAGLSVEDFIASKTQAVMPEVDDGKQSKLTYRLRKTKQDIITPADIIEQEKNRYEAVKGMLLSKTSAISISNARDGAASVTLIGVVRQKGESGFVLEDFTGEIEVVCDGDKNVDEDDVISVRGAVKNGKLVCKDVIYPDVPLLRPIGRIEASLLLMPKPAKPAAAVDAVLSTGPVETETKNIVIEASPSHLNLYKSGGKVSVIFYRTADEMTQQQAINMLKKRSLKKGKGIAADAGAYLIDPVPDILWIAGKGQDWIETYKGVTIVHSPEGSERQAFINLKTREAGFL